jgi:hypothetical protein
MRGMIEIHKPLIPMKIIHNVVGKSNRGVILTFQKYKFQAPGKWTILEGNDSNYRVLRLYSHQNILT